MFIQYFKDFFKAPKKARLLQNAKSVQINDAIALCSNAFIINAEFEQTSSYSSVKLILKIPAKCFRGDVLRDILKNGTHERNNFAIVATTEKSEVLSIYE